MEVNRNSSAQMKQYSRASVIVCYVECVYERIDATSTIVCSVVHTVSIKMSKAASLDKSVINLNVLREDACRELYSILDSIGKDICFVLDPELSGPLNHILVDGISVLKNHGVKDFYAFGKPVKTTCDHILFLIRPSLRGMRYIAKYVRDSGPNKHYYLYFVSCRNLVCDEILKKEGVFGSLTIGEYKLDLIPFDDDLLTLEMECCFKQFFIEKDKSNLQPIANSIIKLQTIFGIIPNIKYKGAISKIVYDQVAQFKREQEIAGNPVGILDPEIETLILIDRTVDLVTPLTTPMTYEGLLDEIMGISNGFITADAELVADEESRSQTASSASGEKKQVTVSLNSNDELYAQVRDYHVERLGMYLQQQAQSIRERYDEFRKNRDASISEIREFVKRIPGLKQSYQSLQQHINLAELIKKTADQKCFRDLKAEEHAMLTGETIFDQLEERIGFQEALVSILRQLCLQSVTSGGIKAKQYDYIRRELIQTYGFQVLPALNNLEKAGLLRRRDTLWNEASGFSSARKSLRLIQEEVNLRDPKSIAYVSQSHAFGYAPLSVRLVESILKTKSWSSIQEALRQLPGPVGEVSQLSSKSEDGNPIPSGQSSKLDTFGSPEDRKVLLVYFIGGVTFMEIAALRFLSNQINSPYDIIIATTKITNGNHLIRSCLDKEVSKVLSN
uniref:Vacuolar protein sortingassociated protein 33A putat n=1 Tax=Albugo laibachii Nc14 TaxID=890382 RepID=F0WDT6_9STRA|nr:vacuolar protein sortingassociated protein 33A putat [Albugo laibachii Nc14]|eukprot:CCA19363.1 vacuolar protein sortingassociated protein 33A putat [Albugo laibachii Nc14]